MGNVFTIKDTTIVAPEPYLLPLDQVDPLLAEFVLNTAPEDIFHKLKIPLSVVNAVISDIEEIKATSIRLMNGQSIFTPEEIVDGEVVSEVVYYDVPQDQIEFMTSMGELIARDFGLKASPVYAISNPSDLNAFIVTALNNLIKYCNGTDEGTWTDFVSVTTV